jgi:hypothetical protein
LRRSGERSIEEIDVVGGRESRATVVGECRWQSQTMKKDVLDDLIQFKMPALEQSGVDTASARVVLFSKSGFSKGLVDQAERLANVKLVDLEVLAKEM